MRLDPKQSFHRKIFEVLEERAVVPNFAQAFDAGPKRSIQRAYRYASDIEERRLVDKTVLYIRPQLLVVVADVKPWMKSPVASRFRKIAEIAGILKPLRQLAATHELHPRLHLRLLPIFQERDECGQLIARAQMPQLNRRRDGRDRDNDERRSRKNDIPELERHVASFDIMRSRTARGCFAKGDML